MLHGNDMYMPLSFESRDFSPCALVAFSTQSQYAHRVRTVCTCPQRSPDASTRFAFVVITSVTTMFPPWHFSATWLKEADTGCSQWRAWLSPYTGTEVKGSLSAKGLGKNSIWSWFFIFRNQESLLSSHSTKTLIKINGPNLEGLIWFLQCHY